MTVITLLAGGAAGILALTAGTFALPRHVDVTRTAIIDADPAQVLALAASGEGYQQFNPYRTADPDLKITPFGPESGVGAGFTFEGKDGKGTQTVAEVTPDTVHFQIDMGAMGQPTQAITARPHANGTEVIWTMNADMGRNPIFRVFGLFMDGMIGKTFEQGLANLETAA